MLLVQGPKDAPLICRIFKLAASFHARKVATLQDYVVIKSE